jgi:LytR cell envelope-related transcriptional attenuator
VDGTCPTCGASVERGQLVCLTCGGRVGLQYKRPPRWQVPVALAVAVVVLAVAGVFFGLQAASDDAKSEVARGPASRQETRAPATTAAKEPEPKKEPPADPALTVAKRGPVAVLSGVPASGAAKRYARTLKKNGFALGEVTNAPGGAGAYSVQYVEGSDDAAKALAEEEGIQEVKAIEGPIKDRAGDAKLVVVIGAEK